MIIDRRTDPATAKLISDALLLQRELGFDFAFRSLRSDGVCADLASQVLAPHIDRRARGATAKTASASSKERDAPS